MASLNFKGKNIIWNHHMSVPYHTLDLDEKLSYKQDEADGNLIIEGDNLPALKSLLPQYAGKIKCIYIDPPYNTGQENWVYNDNVNSPLIKEWMGKEVGKDDLTRHDKWLTMITPRLKLLRELLSEDGVIFISIDDNELHHIRCLMDEIFGELNFIANVIWQHSIQPKGYTDKFSVHHNHILIYRRSEKFFLEPLERTEENNINYSNPDNDPNGDWRTGDVRNALFRPNLIYEITSPGGKIIKPPAKGWRWSYETLKSKILSGEIIFNKDETNIIRKIYLKNVIGRAVETIWFGKEVGTTRDATKELKELLGDSIKFDTPKPVTLIKRIVTLAGKDKNSIVLDAFAGSGTTAQAVLELNEEDKGNRKFILIQMPENSEKEPKKNIARDITRERVVKVIEKKLKNKDIGFGYRRVGQPIDAETILSGQLPTFKQLAKYVYYLATGQSPKDKDIDEKKFLAGKVDHTEVYLLYTPNMEELKKMAITFEWAKEISQGNKNKKIVYAPACFMDEEYLEQFNIKFVSIPYNLFERQQ